MGIQSRTLNITKADVIGVFCSRDPSQFVWFVKGQGD